ncbi:hypothetical protein FGO68_gene9550 [Halteria grandinella]|uniref:TLDc domain-containing protein n=1 Tax=Halteria grandinella TaxID=5974 RepID=A0A8J8NV60_HALGN|nr:hypothetical protein FGO68_gene9550 [Halteria grandinella]
METYESEVTSHELMDQSKTPETCAVHSNQKVIFYCDSPKCPYFEAQNAYCKVCNDEKRHDHSVVLVTAQVQKFAKEWTDFFEKLSTINSLFDKIVSDYGDLLSLFNRVLTNGQGLSEFQNFLQSLSDFTKYARNYYDESVIPSLFKNDVVSLKQSQNQLHTFNYQIKKWEKKDILSDPPLIILWKHYSEVILDFQLQPHLENLNINSINLCLRMKLQKVQLEIVNLDMKNLFAQPIEFKLLQKESFNLNEEQSLILKELNAVPTLDINTKCVTLLGKIRSELDKVAAISMHLSSKQLFQQQQEEQQDQIQQLKRQFEKAQSEQISYQTQKYQEIYLEIEAMKSQISQTMSSEILKLNQNLIEQNQKLQQTIHKSSQLNEKQEEHQAIITDICSKFQESKLRIDFLSSWQPWSGSLIINASQIKTIEGYFKEVGKPSFSVSLLYRATRDGFGAKDFHRTCDNKGPTLTIIKTASDQIIGGYTSDEWDNSGGYKPSYDGWLFTIAYPHPFRRIEGDDNGIGCNEDVGAWFGFGDFAIEDNSNSNTESSVHDKDSGKSYEYGGVHLLNGEGETFFTTKEIEVYEVTYQ